MKALWSPLILLTCCLTACDQSPSVEDDFILYTEKLSAYTKQTFSIAAIDRKAMEYPRPRHLLHKKQEQRISFREFFQLSSCELNRLVGEHNSTLNRNQGHSEILFYNLAFISLAQQCLLSTNDQELPITETLIRATKDKEEDISRLLWNATFASKEFRHFFSPFAELMTDEEVATHHKAISNINFFMHIERRLSKRRIDDDIKDQRSEFDKALGRMSRMRGGGKILVSASVSTAYLREANQVFASLLTSKCDAPYQKFINSTHEMFKRRLAPKLTAIRQQTEEISSLDSMVQRITPKENSFYAEYWVKHWSKNDTSTIGQFSKAHDEHAALLGKLLDKCQKNS